MAKVYRNATSIVEPITEINILIRRLLPDWKDPERGLEQSIVLGGLIDDLIDKHPQEPQLIAMRKNQSDILKSMLVLVEIGIPAQRLPANSQEEIWFRQLYQRFWEADASEVSSVCMIWEKWENPEYFKADLSKAFGVEDLRAAHAIYLQGFYYLTPLQDRIIEAMCGLDIPIYFLNQDDPSHPEAFAIWRCNPHFQKMKAYWLPEKNTAASGCDLYHSDQKTSTSAHPQIWKFRDTFSLVKCIVEKMAHGATFYSPMSKDLKDIFETFFPPKDEKKHMMSYPVGQYLMSLYKMWDSEAQELVFTPELLRCCIASGWAGETFHQDQGLLEVFDRALPFFQNCRSSAEWDTQIEKLLSIYDKVLPLFCDGNVDAWTMRKKNPLSFYAPFSLRREQVVALSDMLHRMMNDAELLFRGSRKIRLEAHFKSLARMLRNKADGSKLYQEEQKVVADLLKRLQMRPSRIKTCSARQLSEAMRFFLGGKLEDEEKTLASDVVRGLSDIESAQFLHPDNEIMICCCDAVHLPGQPKPYSWPLSSERVKAFSGADAKSDVRLKDYVYFMESTRMSDRYLFYLASKLPSLTLSWIAEQDGKILAPSVYLTVLSRQEGGKIQAWNDNLLLEESSASQEYAPSRFRLAEFTTESFGNNPTTEWNWDEECCSHPEWRRFYDFVLSEPHVYRSEFQISFYLPALITVLQSASKSKDPRKNVNFKDVAEHVFNLCPVRDEVMRSEILGFANKTRKVHRSYIMKSDVAEKYGKRYPLARLFLEYLPFSHTGYRLESKEGRELSAADQSQMENQPCYYCPYGWNCIGRRS